MQDNLFIFISICILVIYLVFQQQRGYAVHYVAFVHGSADGGYGISFPDLPGCIAAGRTMDEAVSEGTRALSLHLDGLTQDAAGLPEPRSVQEITEDEGLAAWREGVGLVLIPVVVQTGAPRRVNISLDYGLLQHIDEEARLRGVTRSAFLAGAAWNEIHFPLSEQRKTLQGKGRT